jgi:hypothetical protein
MSGSPVADCVLPETTLSDDALLEGFEACSLASFHHAEHVRVSWILLRQMQFPEAVERMCSGLRRFATAAGAPQKYDDALTRRYMALIDARMGGETSWDEFARANPDLLVWRPSRPS